MPVYFVESTASADEPMFVISVAARLVEMHPQTLRYYERAGLVKPKRSRGSIRLYSQHDIERLRKIARLVDDLGVNLAGVEVILNLTEKVESLQNILHAHQIAMPQNGDADLESETDAPDATPVKIQVRRPRAKTQTRATETQKTKRSNRNG
ncbi:MerR family transcriptional regulator [Anaerolineae bacterium CFX7]|nr:MerR family transcriptional regulator [Anaerolineae bacterium CFX7]